MDKLRYESARRNEEYAYEKEENLHDIEGSLSNAQKQALSRLFEKAAKSYIDLSETELSEEERISKAVELYSKAERYTQYPEVKTRIKKTIEKIKILKEHPGNLEKIVRSGKFFAGVSIAVLIFALFFVSANLTGNVIGGITSSNSRIIGICLFVWGLIFAFIYLKGKEKKK